MIRHLTIIVVLGALALAACPAGIPNTPAAVPAPESTGMSNTPAQMPESDSTPSTAGCTTGKQLDEAAAATAAANPVLDIPRGKYLLLQVAGTVYSAEEGSCLLPDAANWSVLSLREQEKAMREMIQKGAKGFFDVKATRITASSCYEVEERRMPIGELPFAWHGLFDFDLYHVDRDGTVTAQVGRATYALGPGDIWACGNAIWLKNIGLLDESEFPELSVPTPVLATPTTTPE